MREENGKKIADKNHPLAKAAEIIRQRLMATGSFERPAEESNHNLSASFVPRKIKPSTRADS